MGSGQKIGARLFNVKLLKNYTGDILAEAVIDVLPKLEVFVRTNRKPYIAAIRRNRKIEIERR